MYVGYRRIGPWAYSCIHQFQSLNSPISELKELQSDKTEIVFDQNFSRVFLREVSMVPSYPMVLFGGCGIEVILQVSIL
jgi:hypothetical protein